MSEPSDHPGETEPSPPAPVDASGERDPDTRRIHPFSELLAFIWRSGKRIVVFVVGVILVVGGIAMLVLPGPGIVVVIAGLAVLATEFAWAEWALDKAKERAAQAGGAAKKGFGRIFGRNRKA